MGTMARPPLRVVLIDDSSTALTVIQHGLEADATIQVVGTARDGASGLTLLATARPDALVVDLHLPGLDGLQIIREARRRWPAMHTLLFTGTTQPVVQVEAEAYAAGADGFVSKPPPLPSMAHAVRYVRDHLGTRLLALRAPDSVAATPRPAHLGTAFRVESASGPSRFAAVVIGASTGGPDAVECVLRELPASFPVPVLIVQHIGDTVGRGLVERFAASSRLRVTQAHDGEHLQAGTAYVAAPSRHLEVRRSPDGPQLALTQTAAEHFVRPAVDVLFRSAAVVWDRRLLAVVLTGMGEDGLSGARVIKALGGVVIAQDRATSTVWGMPGAVANAGIADAVLPIKEIGPMILTRTCGLPTVRIAAVGGAA